MRPARIAHEVRDAIEARYIAGSEPSSVLPSERRLAAEFGVARATIRAALAMLREQQQIRSGPGAPPVVVDPRLTKAPQLTSFTQDALARGWHPSSRLLEAVDEEADVSIARDLGIAPGSAVHRVRRLRLADRSPMALEEVWLPQEIFPDLLSHDLTGSLYDLFDQRYGTVVYRHDRRISAVSVDALHADLLEIPLGSAALFATQIGYDRHGRRLELGRSVYRGDRFDFTTVTFAARRSPPSARSG
ncbi:GntR family transcriptional regulator [Brachybacterium sp. JB7]|nr:GntR family transcriptional regulator [Brachybacterium sp. JB7]RCS71042.1 GntR family transcriptional regulator [Brachybacterium alimentarium]RCS71558.1 GntR family transcriptional regulator [Brachybacterium alimentarium]RCS75532.1 GntR family transcriptional regulator [Brachybacterium alimentarium]RCS78877.1 GntR family transcriptional regulator [Brachybacterium alimentarium]